MGSSSLFKSNRDVATNDFLTLQLPSLPRLEQAKDLAMLRKLFIAKASEHSRMALVLGSGLQDMLYTVVTATRRENGVSL